MPLELGQFDVMEYLWATLEKTPDGRAINYTALDIEMLWLTGFVDAQKFSLDQWKAVFEPYKRADGTFLLDKHDFFALDQYRYKGEIHIPFDAMRINEGLYTDEGLSELVGASIAPSCSFSPQELGAFFEGLKDLFRTPKGLIKIGPEAKVKIRDMIDAHPSPLRNLEILFDQMMMQGLDKEIIKKIEGTETEKATVRAAIAASTFSAAPATKTEASAKGLKNLEKSRKPAPAVNTQGEVELKKIRRSRRGVRS